jgi:amino acid adenylation domain-containing protein/non-ribosomal peptide synthase protein (TIGR01720 family)
LQEANIKNETLQVAILGGEELKRNHVEILQSINTNIRIFNEYGPTEATVGCMIHEISDAEITIGHPIANTEIYILDNDLNILPINGIGELCISGKGLSKGYLNQEELTKTKFIDHPFKENKKLYKTGDLAKRLSDGNIQYIGRKDDQVKLNGYRIELGEIETALTNQKDISDAVVIVNNNQLVGYIIAVTEIDNKSLQKSLESILPNYMVPKLFMQLETFPLTTNGKLNKKALPKVDDSAFQQENYVAPTNEVEAKLVTIWQDLLGVEKIGIYDNFFELGGDSIKAIQLVSRSKTADIHYQVKDIFSHQTISEIALHLKEASKTIQEEGILEGNVNLHPIQKQFFELDYEAENHYNQSVLLTISKDVRQEYVQTVIEKLANHHDVLRLEFEKEEGEIYPIQNYGTTLPKLIVENVNNSQEITEICNKYQADLNIYNQDITRFVLIETPENEESNRLFIGIHHLAIDGVSWRIFLEDFMKSVENIQAGIPISLPEKATSYRQWTEALTNYASSPALEGEYRYWKKVINNFESLPVDTEHEGTVSYKETEKYSVSLDKASTEALQKDIHGAYGTEINDILLSALSLSLKDWLKTEKVVIGLEGHGREELFDGVDINRTLGWFTTVYPVSLDIRSKEEVGSLIADTKDMLRAIPEKGIGYSVLRYLGTTKQQETLSKDYQEIIFNYLGSFDNSVSKKEDSLIGFASESAGEAISQNNKNPHRIAINSMVVNNTLQLDWSYDSKRYHKETIEKIADNYIAALQLIIAHCNATKQSIKTASDYGLPEAVSNESLAKFKTENQNITDIYPLSPLQEGLLFHSLYDNDTSGYIIQFQCDIISEFSVESFHKTWEYLLEKHTILRTAIYADQLAIPVQCVLEQIEVPIQEMDCTNYSEAQLNTFLEEDKKQGFELNKAPLFRISLLKLGNGKTRMLFTNHHILWDGWSLSSLMQRFMQCYTQFETNGTFPEITTDSYGEHIRHIATKKSAEGIAFWQNYLAEIETPTYLPFVKDTSKRNKIFGNTEKEFTFTGDVQSFTEKHRITVNTLVQAAWAFLLSKYTGQQNTVFGATISGRDSAIKNVEEKVGLYINTIPVATHVEGKLPISEWLQDLQKGHTTAREEYGYLPLGVVEAQSDVKDTLFDSLLVFENYPMDEISSDTNVVFEIENAQGIESTNYSLALLILPSKEGLKIKFDYNNTVISDATIKMIEGHLQTLLQSFLSGAKQLSELKYLTAVEENKLLIDLNQTETDYPKDKNAVLLFEAQAKQNPNNIAVTFEGESLTYYELNERANQFANYLQENSIQKGDQVVFFMNRGIDYLIGMLGVWKVGACFIPLSTDFPLERNQQIISQSNSGIVISTFDLKENVKGLTDDEKILFINASADASYGINNLNISLAADDVSYIIFTSGSTGTPKGAMVAHQGMLNHLYAKINDFNIDENSNVAQTATQVFDVSIWQYMVALMVGGTTTVLVGDDAWDPKRLLSHIENQGITVFESVPAHFSILLDYIGAQAEKPNLSTLQMLMMNGEGLPPAYCERWFKLYPEIAMSNVYGPTECSDDITHYIFNEVSISWDGYVPIGKPIQNMEMYIVDEDMQLVPKGIIGELCTSGDGVGQGYLGRADLTNEKFIPNPFKPNTKLYKTGDLVKWLEDGTIEFIGRKDSQVKISGNRIELGEIEVVLQEAPQVKLGAVLVKGENNNKHLVGYIEVNESYTKEALQEYLEARLPSHMIPTLFIEMDNMPLTPSGKIDRKALPTIDFEEFKQQNYVAATSEIEEKLVEIWENILSVSNIGTQDNFFELGGHSLLAIRLISAIQQAFEVSIGVKDVFTNPTISGIAKVISKGTQSEIPQITVSERPEFIPLSYPQKRLWFLDQLQGSLAYHISGVLKINGALDIKLLSESLQYLVERHESIRTVFKEHDGIGYQEIIESGNFEVSHVQEESQEILNEEIEKVTKTPFDLSNDYMLRASVVSQNNTEHILILVIHHIASDGWSLPILIKELETIYTQKLAGNAVNLPELTVQYADYSIWQRDYLSGEILEEKLDFWSSQLKDAAILELPTDFKRPPVQSTVGTTYHYEISREVLDSINKVAQTQGTTLFITLLSVYKVLLSRYSGQFDISVGTSIANRTQAEIEGLIGFFMNTIVLRDEFKSSDSFETLLQQVKATCLAAYEHQDLPFERIVDELALERDQSRSPLFQTLFVLQNNEELTELTFGNCSVEKLPLKHTTSQLDLIVNASENSEGLFFDVEYSTALFKEDTIHRMLSHFEELLKSVVSDASQAIGNLQMLSADEEGKLVETYNDTAKAYPNATVLELFAEQVTKNPNAIAVDFEGKQLTYTELDTQSTQLTNCLLSEYNVQKGNHIGIHLDRSEAYLVTILGILKAGAVYIPIDTKYPESRKQYILENAGIDLLISDTNYMFELDYFEGTLLALDVEFVADEFSSELENVVALEDTAYVIYTSGSTGNPKGTPITHDALSNYVQWGRETYTNEIAKDFGLFTSPSFDLTITSIFLPLISGGKVTVFKENQDVLELLTEYIESGISCVKLTPSHVSILQEATIKSETLQVAILGGEELKRNHVEILQSINPNIQIFNEYGPTEATVGCMIHEVSEAEITIGNPITNTEIYILDNDLNVLPINGIGELCISGKGLSKGYINREELTKSKFINHPFKENKKLYRTGDLAKRLSDGSIQYIGRKDDQVKLNGYRIELGEIETALTNQKEISDAVVIVNNNQLVAYVISATEIDNKSLQKSLEAVLPNYMVPKLYMQLEAFPLTTNGKLNKKALPKVDDSAYQQENYVAPTNEVEEKLVTIWQDLLGVERIGIYDNFFELGGDSIKAIQLVSRSKTADIHYQVKDIFSHQTISEIALHLKEASKTIQEEGILEGNVKLHPIQKQFFELNYEAENHYNQSVLLTISKDVKQEYLQTVIETLANHHDVLRLEFAKVEASTYPTQNYGTTLPKLIVENVNDITKITEICNKYQADLDIYNKDITRFVLIETPENEESNRLFIGIHHLAIDGVSWRIFLEDFMKSVENIQAGIPISLPEKATSYRQWTEELANYASSPALEGEYRYWKKVINNFESLPTDTTYEETISYTETNHYSVSLDEAATEALQKDIHGAYGTEINDILLSALSLSLVDWIKTEKVVIGLEGHGREELFDGVDINRTLGWFTTVYPVSLDICSKEEVGSLIADTKDMLRAIPEKGIGYSVLRYLGTEEQQETLSKNYQEIIFNYLGSFDNSVSKKEDSLVGFASESAGEAISQNNKNPHRIAINSMVVNNTLQLDWSYDSKRYHKETIEKIADNYIAALQHIISHCNEFFDHEEEDQEDFEISLI